MEELEGKVEKIQKGDRVRRLKMRKSWDQSRRPNINMGIPERTEKRKRK